jgi:hypothetical protein
LGKNPFDVYAGTAVWDEASVTWNQMASSPGSGLGALLTSIPTAGLPNNSRLDVPLPPDLVQSWLDPAASHGLVLDHPAAGRTSFASSEGPLAARPALDVCFAVPTCADGVQNQGEIGIDCGGPCVFAPSAEVCDSPEDESCDGDPGCTGLTAWARTYGDASNQEGWNVAADSAGNVVLMTYFRGTVDLGGGPLTSTSGSWDILFAKLDPDGGHVFSKRFGDGNHQYIWDTAIDASDNIIGAGYFFGTIDFGGGVLSSQGQRDAALVKFDPSGALIWSRSFGDAGDQFALGVAVGATGDIVIAGRFTGTIDFGGGPLVSAGGTDLFLARFDAAGQHLWSQRFGDALDQIWATVALDPSDNAIMAGSFRGQMVFGATTLQSASNLADDVFVALVDPAGNSLWARRFGDAFPERCSGVAADSAGNVLLAGHFWNAIDFGGGVLSSAGMNDLFLAKLDASGQHLWSRRYGDAADQSGLQNAVAVDGAGNIALSGTIQGSVDFGGGPLAPGGGLDAFVAKLDAQGNHLWSRRFGDGADQYANALAVDATGSVLLTGYFAGSADFGAGLVTSAGGDDLFVLRLSP